MILRVLVFLFSLYPVVDLQKDGICPPVLDIIILFDTSGGNDTVFQQQKNWTIKIVRDLPVHEEAVRVGLIQYSDIAKTEFNLSRYSERNDIIEHLETLDFLPGEDTRTGVALNKAEEEIFDYPNGARLKATRLIIVFTDGISMDKPTKAAKGLRRRGVKIYTISVNSIGFVPEMLGIVGDADNVFGPTDEERIEERLLNEVEQSRSCDVQPKRNEKTTSSFGLKSTQFSSILPETAGTNELVHKTLTSATPENHENELNSAEDITNHNESTTSSVLTTPLDTKSTTLSTSTSWEEPVQLFTVETESTQENKVQNLTNLKTSLEEEKNISEIEDRPDENEKKLNESLQTPNVPIISSSSSLSPSTHQLVTETTTSPSIVTTICVNPPAETTTSSATTTTSRVTVRSSFLSKLGVKKEKEIEDPVSKFLGRDVSNLNLIKENEDIEKIETIGIKNSSDQEENKNSTISTTTTAPTRSSVSIRVTLTTTGTTSTIGTTIKSTSTVPSSTTISSTTPPKTTSTPKTTTATTATRASTSSQTASSTETTRLTKTSPLPTLSPSTSSTSSSRTQSSTLIQKSSSLPPTLSAVTAFPTLLSMEKAVTLPINNALGTGKLTKKKIRRIIKRRRNILSSSQAKKVTDKVVEIKRVPTPTTPPIRSTVMPVIIEEKEEEFGSISGVQCPMDILFVVDSSGSIARTYETQKDYLTALIKKVEPSRSHRVGLIQFAGPHIQKMEWSFDTHSKNSQLLSAIRSVRHLTGTTYIGAALELSLILLDSRRKHTETTVILISDGFSQDDSTQQAKLLRQLSNVKMYAISLNKLTNTKYLTDIVGDRKNLFINDESKWFEEFFTKKLRCIPTRR